MVDWSAVSSLLADRTGLPAVVLDHEGIVVLISPAAERALGWEQDGVGASWVERFVPEGAAALARSCLEAARAAAPRRFDLEVLTPEGPVLGVFDFHPFGNAEAEQRGLLLILVAAAERPHGDLARDYDYEVGGLSRHAFELRSLRRIGARRWPRTGTCFEMLHGRKQPCDPCPLSMDRGRSPSTVSVYAVTPQEYEIRTARFGDDDDAKLSVRRLPLASFGAMLQARLGELAKRAGLSRREAAVLGQLVDGRTLDDIGAALGISVRTVKFHQANLLQKLGADSRSDLISPPPALTTASW